MECNAGFVLKTGRKIAERKIGRKVTQEDMAEYLGVSVDSYRDYEGGKRSMSEELVEKFGLLIEDNTFFVRYMSQVSDVWNRQLGVMSRVMDSVSKIQTQMSILMPQLADFMSVVDVVKQVAA